MEALDFGIENEILTPKSGLQHLQVRSEMRHSFNEFTQHIHKLIGNAGRTQTRNNLEVGTIPILHQIDSMNDNEYEDDSNHTVNTNELLEPDLNMNHDEPVLLDSNVNPIEIDFEDIQEEVDFWNSAVVCYIVGSNPPLNVMEG